MKLLLLAALVAATQAGYTYYYLEVSTKDRLSADSDGYFYALAFDYNGNMVEFGKMNNWLRNDFERGRTDKFRFYDTFDLGKISCLVIRAGSYSHDSWLINHVHLTSTTDEVGVEGDNKDDVWLSGSTSEGKTAMMWCRD